MIISKIPKIAQRTSLLWMPDTDLWSQIQFDVAETAIREGVTTYSNRIHGEVFQDVRAIKAAVLARWPDFVQLEEEGEPSKALNTLVFRGNHSILKVSQPADLPEDDTGIYFMLDSLDPDWAKDATTFLSQWCKKTPKQGSVYMAMSSSNGLSFQRVGMGGIPLERGNYTPEVLKGYDTILSGLQSSTPKGRLNILNGPPGSGKSYCVRGLLSEGTKCVFVFIQPELVASLASAGVLPALLNFKNQHRDRAIVFIVEDADDVVAVRGADNMSAVSSLLNFSDGILGSLIDNRFICTTNAKKVELDVALQRPGRLNCHIEVGKLDPATAKKVYDRLMGGENGQSFSQPATLAEVYQLAYNAGWAGGTKDKAPVGFTVATEEEDFLDELIARNR